MSCGTETDHDWRPKFLQSYISRNKTLLTFITRAPLRDFGNEKTYLVFRVNNYLLLSFNTIFLSWIKFTNCTDCLYFVVGNEKPQCFQELRFQKKLKRKSQVRPIVHHWLFFKTLLIEWNHLTLSCKTLAEKLYVDWIILWKVLEFSRMKNKS